MTLRLIIIASLCWAGITWSAERPARVALVCSVCNEQVMQQVLGSFTKEFERRGYVSGRNVDFLVHRRGPPSNVDDYETPSENLLASLYRDVEASRPDVILPIDVFALAAAGHVTKIPVVLDGRVDAIALGLVKNLSRPDRNITGFTQAPGNLDVKRLQLLHEIVPKARRVGVLLDPELAGAADEFAAVRAAGTKLGLVVIQFSAEKGKGVGGDAQGLFSEMKKAKVEAFLILDSNSWSQRVVELALENRLPTVYPYAEVPRVGGLAGYQAHSPSTPAIVDYAVQILRGKKPSELPMEQNDTLTFAINTKTASAIGVQFPTSIHLMATAVVDK